MKNNKIVNAYNEIKPDDYAMQRVWSKIIAERQTKKRTIPMLAATAALLAIVLTAYSLFPVRTDNSFTVRAYALGQLDDGTFAMSELDISAINDAGGWSGFFDGEFLYLNILFDISGENIATANFSTEDGFFAKQYIDFGTTQTDIIDRYDNIIATIYDNVISATIDEFGNLAGIIFNTEIIPLGNRIALKDMQIEKYSYFMAVPYRLSNCVDTFSGENALEIQIDVVFNDGESQSETITLDFYHSGGGMSIHHDIGTLGCFSLLRIDLENATLITESVQILPRYEDPLDRWGVAVHVWEREGGIIYASSLIFHNSGDEQRYSLVKIGDDVIMSLIKVDDNGDLVGMEYIIPGEIILFNDLDRDFQPITFYALRLDDGSVFRLPVLTYNMWTWDE
ncbi:MAG: hypothetical protein FWD05_12880 [Oscillospiraceae bacterium]|nr:hypothetical protein [Oscillospiraceae bacterium]